MENHNDTKVQRGQVGGGRIAKKAAALSVAMLLAAGPCVARATLNPEAPAPVEVEALPLVAPDGAAPAKPATAKKGATKAAGKAADEVKKFGDWAVACPKEKAAAKAAKEAKNQCRMVQTALVEVPAKDGAEAHKERVMLTAVSYPVDDKQAVFSIIVPLGVLIQPGLVLSIEGSEDIKIPLQRCDGAGCLGLLPLKTDLVEALRKGKDAQVTFFAVSDKGSKVRLSLNGFGSALEALTKHPKS